MNSIEILLSYFEKISLLSGEEKGQIYAFFEEKEVGWRHFLLKEGEICTHFYFPSYV